MLEVTAVKFDDQESYIDKLVHCFSRLLTSKSSSGSHDPLLSEQDDNFINGSVHPKGAEVGVGN